MSLGQMLITLLTDFGEGSHYVAQMKGVILGIHSKAQVVDLSHAVAPQAIEQAARILEHVVDAFPADTCHIGVVDPGVGTQRRILMARMHDQFFVAPDNGLLSAVMERYRPEWVRTLDQQQYWRQPVSSTFHGRDIMAPVAAQLGQGIAPEDFGSEIDEWVSLPVHPAVRTAARIEGTVVEIDSFGNLITNVGIELLPVETETLSVVVGTGSSIDFVAAYGHRPAGSRVALIGSGGRLEVAVVNGAAVDQLEARVGDSVVISW